MRLTAATSKPSRAGSLLPGVTHLNLELPFRSKMATNSRYREGPLRTLPPVITFLCSRQQQQRKAAKGEVELRRAEDHRNTKISGYNSVRKVGLRTGS